MKTNRSTHIPSTLQTNVCLADEGWCFQNHAGSSFLRSDTRPSWATFGNFLQIALQTSNVFYLVLVFLAIVWLRDVSMDIQCCLLFFPWLPTSHCVEHSHFIVVNLSKCWNGKEVPHGPLEIITMGSRRPTTVVFCRQLLIQLGTEKLWRKFKTISPSLAKIAQWNHLLPDAGAEWERTAATTGGLVFWSYSVNYQSSRCRGLLILCGLPCSLNDKQAGRNDIYEESVSHLSC